MCQPQAPRSKLQETSGGGQRWVSTPDTPPECREGGGDWLLERGLLGAPRGGLGGGPGTWGKHLSLPQRLLWGCSPSGSRRPPLRPAARGRPSPPAQPTPASWGMREEAVSQGRPRGGPSLPQAALLTRNGRRRAPRRTLSTFQPPAVVPRACHTSSRRLPSTTTSSRKPGKGSLWAARPAPVLRPGALTPHPRTGQRVQRDGGTLGVTLEIVNQAELAAGARGAKGGCERPGLLGQLPPGPLHSQEVPWGEQASELVPPRDPDSAPSLRRGGSWKAGPRLSRAEPHQQPRGRPGWASPCPGPGGAPTAAAPHWRPPSPRLRVTRSLWCLQGQGAWMGLGPRQPLPEGRLGEGRGGPWPAHHIPARPRPPGIAAGSHTAAPGGHTGPHRRSVRARKSSKAAGWMAGARGLGPSTLEVDPPALWASAGVRWVGGACASPRVGREGAQQAHLGLACSGWTG